MKKQQELKASPRKTMRVQYGTGRLPLYWTVKVTDAKTDVVIDGTIMDAMLGTPGETIGCHLSNCAKNNAKKFPHPFYMAAFTKCTCVVIDKIANGAPSHAIRYIHKYGKLVDLNDTNKTRSIIRQNPDLAERQFTLLAPTGSYRKGAVRRKGPFQSRKLTGGHTATVARGALARARKAGLVTADLANALNTQETVK